MGIAERKEREKQEMRELILQVATRMFLEEGYDKTSIRNIADQIEYSPATIYLYFKDKDEIFFAIHEQGFAKFFEKLKAVATIPHPFDRLQQMGRIYLQFAFDNPEYYDLMFIMRAPMKKLAEDENWNCGQQSFGYFRDTVQECIEGGHLKAIDVDLAAFSILSFMHGMTSLVIRDRFKMYPEEQVKQLIDDSIKLVMRLFGKE